MEGEARGEGGRSRYVEREKEREQLVCCWRVFPKQLQ